MPEDNPESEPLKIHVERKLSLTDAVDLIKWSPNEALVACVINGTSIGVYSDIDWSLTCTAQGHFLPILGIAWSPDSRLLATVSKDCTAQVWDARTGDRRARQEAHITAVTAVTWSPEGRELASGSFDGSIKVWDSRSGRVRLRVAGHSNCISVLSWSPNNRIIASASSDGLVRTWKAETGASLHSVQISNSDISALAWSPKAEVLAVPSSDLTVKLIDATTGRPMKSLAGHAARVSEIEFSKDGNILFTLGSDGELRAWDTRSWQTTFILPKERKVPTQIAALRLGTRIAGLDEKRRSVIYLRLEHTAVSVHAVRGPSIQYKSAKIALVGDNGVGKTGLGWKLANGSFKEHASTHGQQFWVIPELGGKVSPDVECEAVLWDFAGQQDYRLIHSLFLDDVELALVLFDPTDELEPLKGAEFWVHQLAPTPALRRKMILVGGRLDRGAPTLTRQDIEAFASQNGFIGGYVGTSAKTGEGVPELFERIKSLLNWQDIPSVVTSPAYSAVKACIVRKKQNPNSISVLSTVEQLYNELQSDLSAVPALLSPADVKSAVGHLSAHGVVSILPPSSGMELILLNPNLLINLASSFVLEARKNPRGLGVLEERRLLRGEYKCDEIAGLAFKEIAVLCEAAAALFLRHNICFRETLGTETLLVFPALINLKRPFLPTSIPIEDDVTYRIRGEVENLYSALVVLLGYTNTFTRTNQWQDQAQYEMNTGQVCGFQQIVTNEGDVEFVIYYAKTTPDRVRRLFEGLFDTFLHGRNLVISKYRPVKCGSCGDRQDRGAVIRQYLRGATAIYCLSCGFKITLPAYHEIDADDWSERRVITFDRGITELRTGFETAMVRVKALLRDQATRDKRPSCFLSYCWGDAKHERWVNRLATDLQNADCEVIFDQWHNVAVGASIARFVERLEVSEFVIIVGTRRYLEKYEKNESMLQTGSVLVGELDIINQRLLGTEGQKRSILPVLLEGEADTAFPVLARGRLYGDFRKETHYFVSLFDLILTMVRVGFDKPGIMELREALKSTGARLESVGIAPADADRK